MEFKKAIIYLLVLFVGTTYGASITNNHIERSRNIGFKENPEVPMTDEEQKTTHDFQSVMLGIENQQDPFTDALRKFLSETVAKRLTNYLFRVISDYLVPTAEAKIEQDLGLTAIHSKMDTLNATLISLNTTLDSKVTALDSKVTALDSKVTTLDRKLESMSATMNQRFNTMNDILLLLVARKVTTEAISKPETIGKAKNVRF